MEASDFDLKKVRDLVKSGKISVNSVFLKNNRKISLLQLGIEASDDELIDFLLTNHVDLDFNSLFLGTALHMAVNKKDINLVKKLVNFGADVNILSYGYEQLTPLHVAVKVRSFEIVELLLMSGADVDAKRQEFESSCYRWSTLDLAIFSMDARIVELLLKNNATIELGSENVYSSLRLAIRTNDMEIVRILKNYGAVIKVLENGKYTEEFDLVVKEDNVKFAKIFLENCNDLNSIVDDYFCDSLLHKAVKSNSSRILQYLLNCGMDVNLVNRKNFTALELAKDEELINRHNRTYTYVKVINMIEEHIIKLCAINHYVTKRNLKLINDDKREALYENCIQEINLLKASTITESNFTVHSILIKNIHKLALSLKYVDDCFYEEDFTFRFYFYGGMIFERLRKGMRRRDLLRNSQELYEILSNYLPDVIIREIFIYLTNDDLILLS